MADGSAPMLPLGHLAPPGVGVTVYALAVLHCNTSQAGRRAIVRASSSAQAVGYFNGEQVFRANWMAGLLASEEEVEVKLQGGRNELLVKSVNVWMNASTWALQASIEPRN